MAGRPKIAPEPDHYDALILGSGEAGKYLAWHLALTYKKVALIERRYIGASCPNIACLPSKNVIHPADLVHDAHRVVDVGILPTDVARDVHMGAVRQRKREMVSALINMHEERFQKSSAELILGNGRFVASKTLAVNTADGQQERVLSADIVIISTGSRAFIDTSIPGLAKTLPLTHVELLDIPEGMTHVIILGGGYSGLEFAQALRRLGSEVTVIERHHRVLKQEDDDVALACRYSHC